MKYFKKLCQFIIFYFNKGLKTAIRILTKLWCFLFENDWVYSSIAMFCVFLLGFFSMGFLGLGLYALVSPILSPWMAKLNETSGDWAWPAMIDIGVFWGFGFLIAGMIDHRFIKKFAGKPLRAFIYIFILWLTALILWAGTLYANMSNSN